MSTNITDDAIERAKLVLEKFNGGLVDVANDKNPRGYITMYKPVEAMVDALAAITAERERTAGIVEAAHEALEISADLIANMFKNGAAHNMDNSCENAGSKYGSYYIGEGILPKVCAARDALAALNGGDDA